ncbi:deoxyguanosinetriphosphate triphosphohydrolase [Georgenia sp. EYE_87]|uniref:deoxyguanosinetriphosphate triphosphohydrolase n=1 Tax=Georgenia sp. EYE_87 TaxID=2853448 RepID=UPI002004AA00|nr:deoxyguanosinetriphosphate triphosphohydrolase [Georgenia sp. EYE_87]MCK6209408.1 deoxyguanosinetriphosphate triphosphohydrolase [Georgenia sp. EYE_87]
MPDPFVPDRSPGTREATRRPGGPEAYTGRDRERWWSEAPKNPRRTAFERDRARVLHSSALRRLGAKTQVLGPSSDDFVRTRLTHSLEVAQVGRELGKVLGCDPDVVDTACLSHDLGHPPFGHNGERALHEVAAGIGGFEGNAQTLRLLSRLEPKVFADDGTCVGLNLTRASLDAATKYPWQAGDGPPRPDGSATRKFGVYADDAPVFAWLRQGAPERHRCLEAQVMDLADDISYSVHDVEDAIVGGRVDLAGLRTAGEQDRVVAQVRDWYDPPVADDMLGAALERLIGHPIWVQSYDGSRRDLARLKDLTSQLIGRFCAAAEDATRERYGTGPLTRYDADLIVPDETLAEIVVLKGVAALYVMAPREHEPLYLAQRTVIFDLVDVLAGSGPAHLEAPFATDWREAGDDAARLRVVIDQVASLTDTSAQQWHARLCGMLSAVY